MDSWRALAACVDAQAAAAGAPATGVTAEHVARHGAKQRAAAEWVGAARDVTPFRLALRKDFEVASGASADETAANELTLKSLWFYALARCARAHARSQMLCAAASGAGGGAAGCCRCAGCNARARLPKLSGRLGGVWRAQPSSAVPGSGAGVGGEGGDGGPAAPTRGIRPGPLESRGAAKGHWTALLGDLPALPLEPLYSSRCPSAQSKQWVKMEDCVRGMASAASVDLHAAWTEP